MQGVVVLSSDQPTVQLITSALSSNGRLQPGDVLQDVAALSSRLERQPAPAVVVDLGPQPLDMLANLDVLIDRHRRTEFIAVSESQRSDVLLRAMQAGVRHFVVKSSVGADLPPLLRRLERGDAGVAHLGQAVAVLSAAGGSGATSIVVNLAFELQAMTDDPILLVDLDTAYGAVATYLGVQGRFGVADVLAQSGRIDDELIRSTAQSHSDQLSVLLSPASAQSTAGGATPGPALNLGELSSLATTCRDAFAWTIFDAPRLPTDAMAALVDACQMTLLVFQLNVKDVRHARRMVDALRDRAVDTDTVVPVVNRYRAKRLAVTADEASQVFGGRKLQFVDNDFRAAIDSIDRGEPLIESAPRSKMRKDIRALAQQVQSLRPQLAGAQA